MHPSNLHRTELRCVDVIAPFSIFQSIGEWRNSEVSRRPDRATTSARLHNAHEIEAKCSRNNYVGSLQYAKALWCIRDSRSIFRFKFVKFIHTYSERCLRYLWNSRCQYSFLVNYSMIDGALNYNVHNLKKANEQSGFTYFNSVKC